MENSKDLLRITRYDKETHIDLNIETSMEVFVLAFSLFDVLKKRPDVSAKLANLLDSYATNPEAKKAIDECYVKMPDFNELLKKL